MTPSLARYLSLGLQRPPQGPRGNNQLHRNFIRRGLSAKRLQPTLRRTCILEREEEDNQLFRNLSQRRLSDLQKTYIPEVEKDITGRNFPKKGS